ncbi:MAG: insulinase family protein [Alistipes senegalensis]|nr:insulinase family protein [Bacteroides cellulosilyticus]MCM1351181.1 insulinase family protein [Alistipes senegalensis]
MKKLLFWAVVVVAMLTAACSKYKYERVSGDPLKTRIYTLDNGLKVYMSVSKEKPRIQTYIAVKVGGKNDPHETTGLAHYFEHLMFKGTEQFGTSDYAAEKPLLDEIEMLFETYRLTTDEAERAAIYHRIDSISYEASKIAIPNEYDKLMAAIGANGTNAYTSQDMTVYVEDIPSNQIDNWARIQADRFRHPVIRGFHTELETIYEEKNMSLTRDSRKVWETLDAALFPHHPYGTQTVLGTQEHLKNPSITNVKNYHKTYYVPNNIAICVAGDFDPDEMIATIDKYFGAMEPNPNLPKLEFEPEQPITTPVVKEVYGLEAANVTLGWRLPGETAGKEALAGKVAGQILYNGQAGLIDLDLNQLQKTLGSYGYYSGQPDYSTFFVAGRPKQGQSLEAVRDLLLGEVAKLRSGDFDEALLEAVINDFKMSEMQSMENDPADLYVNAFIYGIDWADQVHFVEDIAKVTKQDVIDWANEYLGPESYAVVYKREGEDKSVQKISAPKITPIVTNRDQESAFLAEIKATEVKPIEPVYVDYDKDMSKFSVKPGVDVLYKQNETNDIFTLSYVFNTGTENDPALNLAFNYVGYLGTDAQTAEEIAKELYRIGCSFGMSAGATQSSITLSGLSENMGKAMEIVDALLLNAVPDEAILANLKSDMMKSRADAKLNQARCFNALRNYLFFGGDYMKKITLSNKELAALTSGELLGKVKELYGKAHEVLYYGPQSESELKTTLAEHHKTADVLEPLNKQFVDLRRTDKSEVILAQYDAKQLYYVQYSNRGEKFDETNTPALTLYNEYFGGGMNSIVFQEMREARGLAYSAWAALFAPGHADGFYGYQAFIATQNDKMRQAIEAFDEIIEKMPESEAAFVIAKEGILARLRTERTTKSDVLWSYINLRDMGLTEDRNKLLFDEIQHLTLDDVKATQEKWVKNRHYIYGILGDIKDLDTKYLKTLGPVKTVSSEEIFGY